MPLDSLRKVYSDDQGHRSQKILKDYLLLSNKDPYEEYDIEEKKDIYINNRELHELSIVLKYIEKVKSDNSISNKEKITILNEIAKICDEPNSLVDCIIPIGLNKANFCCDYLEKREEAPFSGKLGRQIPITANKDYKDKKARSGDSLNLYGVKEEIEQALIKEFNKEVDTLSNKEAIKQIHKKDNKKLNMENNKQENFEMNKQPNKELVKQKNIKVSAKNENNIKDASPKGEVKQKVIFENSLVPEIPKKEEPPKQVTLIY